MKFPVHGNQAADTRWMSLVAMVSQNGRYCNAEVIQRHFANLWKPKNPVGGTGCPPAVYLSNLPAAPVFSRGRAPNHEA